VDIIGAQAFGFELTKLHKTTWISIMVASSCPEADEPEFRHISFCNINQTLVKKIKLSPGIQKELGLILTLPEVLTFRLMSGQYTMLLHSKPPIHHIYIQAASP